MEKVWRLLKKLTIDLPYDPTISFLGIYPMEVSQVITKSPTAHVYCSTIYNS
jgi:hypothetical protein